MLEFESAAFFIVQKIVVTSSIFAIML